MPEKSSYAETTSDWDGLLTSCAENSDLLPNTDSFQTAVRDNLAEARRLKAAQEQAEGIRQETTQKLNKTLVDGREAARLLRSVIRAHLGSKSERLPQFRIAPLRSRTRKKAAVPPPGPGEEPQGPTSGPA